MLELFLLKDAISYSTLKVDCPQERYLTVHLRHQNHRWNHLHLHAHQQTHLFEITVPLIDKTVVAIKLTFQNSLFHRRGLSHL